MDVANSEIIPNFWTKDSRPPPPQRQPVPGCAEMNCREIRDELSVGIVGIAAVGEAAGAFEDAGGDDAEEESGNMRDVGDAAGLHVGKSANVEDLHEKPEEDEGQRRDSGDAFEFGLSSGPIRSLIQR